MTEPVPIRVPVQIRWRDLDALGHVNNAVYITYFEFARLAYIRALLGPDATIDRRTTLPTEFQFILAEVNCQFRQPITLSDRPVVAIWVSQVGRKSFVFQYRITDERESRLYAEGCSTQVWFDYVANESRPVPGEIVARMESLQGAVIARPESRL